MTVMSSCALVAVHVYLTITMAAGTVLSVFEM